MALKRCKGCGKEITEDRYFVDYVCDAASIYQNSFVAEAYWCLSCNASERRHLKWMAMRTEEPGDSYLWKNSDSKPGGIYTVVKPGSESEPFILEMNQESLPGTACPSWDSHLRSLWERMSLPHWMVNLK